MIITYCVLIAVYIVVGLLIYTDPQARAEPHSRTQLAVAAIVWPLTFSLIALAMFAFIAYYLVTEIAKRISCELLIIFILAQFLICLIVVTIFIGGA